MSQEDKKRPLKKVKERFGKIFQRRPPSVSATAASSVIVPLPTPANIPEEISGELVVSSDHDAPPPIILPDGPGNATISKVTSATSSITPGPLSAPDNLPKETAPAVNEGPSDHDASPLIVSSPDARSGTHAGGTTIGEFASELALEALRTTVQVTDAIPVVKSVASGILWVFERFRAVKGVQSEYVRLDKQVGQLVTMLQPEKTMVSRDFQQSLDGLSRILDEKKDMLEKKLDRSVAERIVFSAADTQLIMEILRDIRFSIQVTMLNIMIRNTVTTTRIDETILRMIDNATLEKLGNVSGAQFNHEDRQGCTPGTRVALLAHLLAWAMEEDSPHIFWLDGAAGTGKTALLETFCRLLALADPNILGATFFCSIKFEQRKNIRNIFPSLAKSLAIAHPAFRDKLVEVLKTCSDPLGMNLKDQFQKLILQPATDAYGDDDIKVICIDALDECEDKTATETLLGIILENKTAVPLRFFLTSRPESVIRESFESFQNYSSLHLHDIEDHIVQADIALYMTERLWTIKALQKLYIGKQPPSEVLAIAKQAGKLFIVASTICEYIANRSSDPCERLQKLAKPQNFPKLKGINGLYMFILHEAFQELDDSEIERIQSCFYILLSAQQPLSVSIYAHLLDIKISGIYAAFRALHSVVRMPGEGHDNNRISVYHASFPDYLTMHNEDLLPKWSVNMHSAHKYTANQCFKIMNSELHFGISGAVTSYFSNKDQPKLLEIPPHLAYACTSWSSHILLPGTGNMISNEFLETTQNFLHENFLYWLEGLSALGEVPHGLRMLHQMSQKVPLLHSLKHMMVDFTKFVTAFLDPIRHSAPHIYLSALPFVSQHSMVSKIFCPKFKSIPMIPIFDDDKPMEDAVLQFEGHTSWVLSVAFSPDGKLVASCSFDKTVCLWNVESGEAALNPFEGHTSWVHSVAFSPDGKLVASGSNDQKICMWNLETGKAASKPFEGHTSRVTSVAFSPDGKSVVSGSFDKTVCLWNVGTGEAASNPFEGHLDRVHSVAFSPDGNLVASGSEDKTVCLWNIKTGQAALKPFEGHTGPVWSVAFSPDGKLVASGSQDNTICLWNVETGEIVLKPFIGHTHVVTSVAFSPDGTLIASGSVDETVCLWNVETGEAASKPFNGHTGLIRSVSFSPDGNFVASGSQDKTIRLWNVKTSKVVSKTFEEYTAPVQSAASGSSDPTIHLWNAETGEAALNPFQRHKSVVWSVAFSPDSKLVASGSYDKRICLWNIETGKAASKPFEGHTGPVWSVTFSPDGMFIASGSEDCTVCLWNVKTSEVVSNPFEGHTAPVLSVAFSPDGKLVASGSEDYTVCLWNVKTGNVASKPFEGHTQVVVSVSFSPDGKLVASGSEDKTVRLWNVETGEAASNPFEGHTSGVWSVSFSPNGKLVASGSYDNTICLWNIERDSEVAPKLIRGHTSRVTSVAFSPNGNLLASGSYDKTIRLWNVETGEAASKLFKGHTNFVCSVAFSPNGKLVASGAYDSTVHLWNIESSEAASQTFESLASMQALSSPGNPQLYPGSHSSTGHFMFINDFPSGSISLHENGWLHDAHGHLVIWIPGSQRLGLVMPDTMQIFGVNTTKIEIRQKSYGNDWLKCILPS